MKAAGESAYQLLERPIQHVLWDMGWQDLRPIQIEAIQKILTTKNDVLISARTASGKTEAAFLPILSHIYREPAPSIQAIYVGPLKALINDQFQRLEDLCHRAEIAVHRWHGDVPQGKKKAFLKNPSGVLLITPESIESLFINHSTKITALFHHLKYVVIDEIHAMIGVERGTHLRSLLFRLQAFTKQKFFRMACLSATIGDAYSVYQRWIRPDGDNDVSLIIDKGEQKTVRLKIYGYEKITEDKTDSNQHPIVKDKVLPDEIIDCFEHMKGRKNLVFANSRQMVESFADSLNGCCRKDGMPEQFLVHHGSLSKEIREHTEDQMKGDRHFTTVCSSTLELGIDIGNVATVGQVGPTWSVNSLAQRLGRSGRGENEAQCLRLYVLEPKVDEKTALPNQFRSRLLQAIATVELLLEKWYEEPNVATTDFSTLTQQIFSILAETGGTTAQNLYQLTVGGGAFRSITPTRFKDLLRCLANKELIEQMPQGDLILAPRGESIVEHYSFYSVFMTSQEFTVVNGSEKIGQLPAVYLPKPGDHVLLGARRWQVIDVEEARKTILVKPAKGRKPPKFEGSFGEIHHRLREKMKEVLVNDDHFGYLNDGAHKLLDAARMAARKSGVNNQDWISTGANSCYWFTWTGTKIQRTLLLICEAINLDTTDCEIAIHFNVSINDARAKLKQALTTHFNPIDLASMQKGKHMKKYDEYLDENLLDQAIANDLLDLDGAKALLSRS